MREADVEYQDEVVGRCVTCGFLAAHRERWHEVTDDDRAAGNLTRGFGTGYDREINTRPACFRRAFNLSGEWDAEVTRTQDANASSLAVMQKYRYCEAWTPYTAGFSPKEHLEAQRARETEDDRQRFERQMEDDRRRFQLKVEGAFQTFSKRWTIAAVVVGVIAAVIGVTGVIFTALGYFAVHH